MRVHHLSCGTMCPWGGAWISGAGGGGALTRAELVCHCLLVETDDAGLVLVDTGYGVDDCRNPKRLGTVPKTFLNARFDENECAVRQIEALGFSADDVRHICVTHLDLDHAGGLGDFPRAKVHLMRRERDAAANPTWRDRPRYFPAQWAHDPDWRLYDVQEGERWFGFEAVRALDGLPPEILLVPTHGHSAGHAAIAIETDHDGWLLHAGDAYFHHGEMEFDRPHCPGVLRVFQSVVANDDQLRRFNQRRLRTLAHEHSHEVRVFSAHDPAELAAFD